MVRQAVAREGYRGTRERVGGEVGAADEGENLATNRLGQGRPGVDEGSQVGVRNAVGRFNCCPFC